MERLPRGRHDLSPEYVAENQRQRLITALTTALSEVGYQKTTVAVIGQRAGISKSDFYKHFESKDDCFLAAYEVAVERVRECLLTVCVDRRSGGWTTRVCEAFALLLSLFSDAPALASIVLVEGLRVGQVIYDRYQAALASFVPYLHDGAPPAPDGVPIPVTTAEAVIGGVASLLERRVLAGEGEQLQELLPEVLEFALTPYLGVTEARRIVSSG